MVQSNETGSLSGNLLKKIKQRLETAREPEVYWQQGDSLSQKQIETILTKKDGFYEVENEIWEMNMDYISDLEHEHIVDVLKEFSDEIEEELGETDMEELAVELADEFLGLFSVNLNIKDLIRGASDIPVRITLYSNYDCLNSNWYMESGGGYTYDDYFKQIIDFLHLNPRTLQAHMQERGIATSGKFPNKRKRNGKELVDYKEFLVELENNSCASNLTFVATIDLDEMIKNGMPEKFTIPKGNSLGLFSYFQGGGSPLDATLKRDLVIDTTKHFETKYDHISLTADQENDSYSISSVYGVTSSFWGDNIKIIKDGEE